MKDAGMPEADFEAITIHAIIDGTAQTGAWNAFRTSIAMCAATAYPRTIKELESMMTAYAVTIHEKTWDKPDWRVPNRTNKWNNTNNEQQKENDRNDKNWNTGGTEGNGETSSSYQRGRDNNDNNLRGNKSTNKRNATSNKHNTAETEHKLLSNIKHVMANWTETETQGDQEQKDNGKLILDCVAYPSFTNAPNNRDKELTEDIRVKSTNGQF